MARYTIVRAASLALAVLGALTNFVVASYVLSLWRVLKWESESEWEGSANGWRVDSIKLVWLLVASYFSTATVVCLIGAFGVIKRAPSLVRLYRDYSLTDICVCGLLTIATAVVSFRPVARATVCEEISGQPELLRDLAEAGLNVENCEEWFEHAVLGFVGVTAILLVVRLQFFFTVSSFYKQLMRQSMYGALELSGADPDFDTSSGLPQRVFLLPARHPRNALLASGMEAEAAKASKRTTTPLIYAPVPLESLSEAEAQQLKANEAWVSRTAAAAHQTAGNHFYRSPYYSSHSRSHRQQHGYLQPGLPVLTEESPLPPYTDSDDVKA